MNRMGVSNETAYGYDADGWKWYDERVLGARLFRIAYCDVVTRQHS